MEIIKEDGYVWVTGQWFKVDVQAHYAGKDFNIARRTSPEHGWREVGELTREQVTEFRDLLSAALERWS